MKTLTLQHRQPSVAWNSVFFFIASIGISLTGNIQLMMAFFPFVVTRSFRDEVSFLAPSVILFFYDPLILLQFVVFVMGYHIFSYGVFLAKGDVFKISQLYMALSSFAVAYIATKNVSIALTFAVIQIIYYHELMKTLDWLNKEFSVPRSIYAICVISLVLLLIQFLPQFPESVMIIGLIFLCFGCSPLISITSFFFMNLLIGGNFNYEIFVYIYLLSLLREQTGLMLLVYFGLFVMHVENLTQVLLVGLYLVILLLLSKEGIPVETEQIRQSNSKAYLHKQLNHFSMIFDHLGTYYENISAVESSFLKSMSRALQYTSKKCSHEDRSVETIKNQVISILEGYNIGYEDVMVEESDEGFLRIVCSLLHFHAQEVNDVLLPLLNHILPTPMECSSINTSLKHLGILNVEFISSPPVQIDAYADSLHPQICCGDSFSVFHHSRNVYCLISDGMGSGLEASKISKCIVNLFQRMIYSNIQEIEAMNCINKLLLSDAYATCDVLSFDRYHRSVTICKSAANPTYLIRKKELFAIWGSSLPIGIVAHIDVDHIHVEVEKGDWFVMSSDGVSVEEILTWMKESENQNARKEVNRFVEILKQTPRNDDSTILLAKVV